MDQMKYFNRIKWIVYISIASNRKLLWNFFTGERRIKQ